MSATTTIAFALQVMEASANDLGTATMPHKIAFPDTLHSGDYESGTIDNKFDIVWSDTRTLVATSEQLDVRGVLTAALGGAALNFIEVCGIFIVNTATAATSVLLVGAGGNPAFAGLFGATGDIIKVPASGLLAWFAPLDGGGLATTGGTADMITVDSGAATITYKIVILGRSA